MIGYFLIPMTSPPYGRANPQRPLFCDKLNWSGSPLFKKNVYLVKVGGTGKELNDLANQKGVVRIDFDENKKFNQLSRVGQDKVDSVCKQLDLEVREGETVGELINRIANSEGGFWDRRKVYTGE